MYLGSSAGSKATDGHERGAKMSDKCCKKTPHVSSGLEPHSLRSFHKAYLSPLHEIFLYTVRNTLKFPEPKSSWWHEQVQIVLHVAETVTNSSTVPGVANNGKIWLLQIT